MALSEPAFDIREDYRKVVVTLGDATATWFKGGKMRLVAVCHGAPYDDLIKCVEKLKQITGQR